MQSALILARQSFILVGLSPCDGVVVRKRVFAQALAARHNEPASRIDRHGSLRGARLISQI
jgi:hypothetical protein